MLDGETLEMPPTSPRKRDSDTTEVPPHLQVVGQDLDQYRIRQLEKAFQALEARVGENKATLEDIKVWRGYVLGAIAASSFILGILIAVLSWGWFQWKN